MSNNNGYTPFPIANSRTGLDQAVEPWLIPRDGWQVVKNAHMYRGVVEKILGYELYAYMSYRTQMALTGTINGTNKVFTGTLSPLPSTTGTTVSAAINAGGTLVETFTDVGNGVLSSSPGGTGTLDYTTGVISVTFNTAPAVISGGFNSVVVQWDSIAVGANPDIMGIEQYYGEAGSQDIMIFDTRRMGLIVPIVGTMAALQGTNYGIEEVPHEVQLLPVTSPPFDGSAVTFAGTSVVNISPGGAHFTLYNANGTVNETFTDNGSSLLTGSLGSTGFINYSVLGAWTITFTTAPASDAVLFFGGCVFGDVFTGDFTDFFSVASSSVPAFPNLSFITNNTDPLRYYDGDCLRYLNTNITVKVPTPGVYDITRALHVVINRAFLLILAPVVQGQPQLNNVYWSASLDPLNFSDGNNLPAPTSEPIRAQSFINTDLVIKFANSERVFRFTSDAFDPFRWDATNLLWRCDASFSAINYDSYFTAVGRPAIVGSDAVNIQRADEIIPDFTLNSRIPDQQPVLAIDQTSIGQCFGRRFDDFKEGWLCYKAFEADDNNSVLRSDTVLAFNYLDKTYATYTFPFSVLGFGNIISNLTWGTDFREWGTISDTWDSFYQDANALVDLGGGHDGVVYLLGTSNTMGLTNLPVLMDIVSKSFNPFIEQGELVRLGYVDFFFSSNTNTTLRIQFYKDDYLNADFDTFYQETKIVLTGTGKSKVWKRIYVGAVGKEHTIRIYQVASDFTDTTLDQSVRLHAMVPYMKPAGRIYF